MISGSLSIALVILLATTWMTTLVQAQQEIRYDKDGVPIFPRAQGGGAEITTINVLLITFGVIVFVRLLY
jgi:hypothetical protein